MPDTEFQLLGLTRQEMEANFQRMAEQMAQMSKAMQALPGQEDHSENEEFNYETALSGSAMRPTIRMCF